MAAASSSSSSTLKPLDAEASTSSSIANSITLKPDVEAVQPKESPSTAKFITLKPSDGEAVQVKESIAMTSEVIKYMVEDDCGEGSIPIDVTTKTLDMILRWGNQRDVIENDEKFSRWEKSFTSEMDKDDLSDLILAANYLNIKALLGAGCQEIADRIKGKSPEQIREEFGIQSDFSPEEEELIRQENTWVYEE